MFEHNKHEFVLCGSRKHIIIIIVVIVVVNVEPRQTDSMFGKAAQDPDKEHVVDNKYIKVPQSCSRQQD